MPVLNFTHNLKRYYPDLTTLEVRDTSINAMISTADNKYPGLKSYILDEQGHLRKHVQIFIGEDMIKDRESLSDEIKPDDQVYIMQALSGG